MSSGDEELSHVLSALNVLVNPQAAPEEIAAADSYLRAVRTSSNVLGVASTILRHRDAPPVALQFLTGAVEEQVRLSWGALSATDRLSVFQLSLALVHNAAAKQVPPAVEHGCNAAAACVARMSHAERDSGWKTAVDAGRAAGCQCEMLCALINELDGAATGSAAKERERREFAREQSSLAVGEASSVLSKPESSSAQKLAAVRCLKHWRPHAARGSLTDVLASAMFDESLCEAAGEVLAEEVGEGELGASALVRICSALRTVLEEKGMRSSQALVVAVVSAAAADGSIEEMLVGDVADRVGAAVAVVALMQMCLESPLSGPFTVAADGWATLAATAAALREERTSVHVITDQIPAAVRTMLNRSQLPAANQTKFWDDELAVDEAMRVRAFVRDALLQSSIALGCDTYVQSLLPYLQELERNGRASRPSEEVEAVMFALAAAGDSLEEVVPSSQHREHNEHVYAALRIALHVELKEMRSRQFLRSSMALVRAFAGLAVTDAALYDNFSRAVTVALQVDAEIAAPAARVLADAGPALMVPRCDELLAMFTAQLDYLSTSAASDVSHALFLAAAQLPADGPRQSAFAGMADPLAKRVQGLASAVSESEVARRRTRVALSALASGVRAFNDPAAGARLLRDLAEPIGRIAHVCSAPGSASRLEPLTDALCTLLEAATLGRASDVSSQRELADPEVSRGVLDLVAGSFIHSAATEARWLKALSFAIEACVARPSPEVEPAANQLAHVAQAVSHLLVSHDPASVPDMVQGLFEVLLAALHSNPAVIEVPLPVALEVGMKALRLADAQATRDALRWWQDLIQEGGVLKPHVDAYLAENGSVLARALFQALGGLMSHRSAVLIANVLLAMIGRPSSPFDAPSAFESVMLTDGVPAAGLTPAEKECMVRAMRSVVHHSNKRRFKSFVADVSHFCRQEATLDVFLAYEM